MNVQHILTAAFYAVTIGFLLGVIYREMTVAYRSSLKVLQVSTLLRKVCGREASLPRALHQEQDLCGNTLSDEQTIASQEISHEPIILLPVIEEKCIEIAEPKMLTLIEKKELDLTNMNVTELREECGKRRIKWREAVNRYQNR